MTESLPSSSSSSSLSPGVVFDPTRREILQEFLARKVHNLPLPHNAIIEMDVYDHQPWLYASGHNGKYSKYYFVKREKKSISESAKNPKRRLKSKGNSDTGGWWQAITGDKPIRDKRGRIIGFEKTLRFHTYKNQKFDRKECIKTGWIMHEYKLPHTTFQEWVVCGIRYNGRKGTEQEYESQSAGHRDMIDLSKEEQSQCLDQHLQQKGCSMLEDQQSQAHQDLAYDQICNAYPLLNIGSDGQRCWANTCDFGLSEQASALGCHSTLELDNKAQDSNRSLQLNGSNELEMANNKGLLGPDFCGLNDPSWNGFQDTQVQLPKVESVRESELEDGIVYYDLWS
ncbi:NAC domain-containing protein 83-like [Diospyros lotus]|uniref:NAC domain-containing protein 83-like n=1 Tax=Diospyros lotus TaxID=55363 RepID=UPI00225013D7|nr:NAC domain-containing protein 83-like [Diospyros lotus]